MIAMQGKTIAMQEKNYYNLRKTFAMPDILSLQNESELQGYVNRKTPFESELFYN